MLSSAARACWRSSVTPTTTRRARSFALPLMARPRRSGARCTGRSAAPSSSCPPTRTSRTGFTSPRGSKPRSPPCSATLGGRCGARGSADALKTFPLLAGDRVPDPLRRSRLARSRRRAGLRRALGQGANGKFSSAGQPGSARTSRTSAMADDEDNVIHFAPRADAHDAEKNYVPNPLNLRRELHRNALTKGLVGFDEFAQQIVLQRPIPRPNLKASKRFEPRPGPIATTPRSPSTSTPEASSVSDEASFATSSSSRRARARSIRCAIISPRSNGTARSA